MNVVDLKKELSAVSGLISARRESLNNAVTRADKAKEAALVGNLSKKIQGSLVCSIAEAQSLYDCLKGTNLENDYKDVLRNSIDTALTSGLPPMPCLWL
jgi:hypothetical protein